MSGTSPEQVQAGGGESPNQTPRAGDTSNAGRENSDTNTRTRPTRRDNRPSITVSTTQRDFKGATPDIGAVLALRSENVTMKTSFDKFCEKLVTHIMNEFKAG